MKKLLESILISLGSIFGLSACAESATDTEVVTNFQLDRYLGTWYEVARLDHSFERGMDMVTANYSLRADGNVKVLNKGFKTNENEWSESVGKAKFAGSNNRGSLKVSFFGPFYGAYKIVKLDPNYQYALVVSKGTKYLWLLSRQKTMPDEIKQQYLEKARQLGFDTGLLIWVKQD